MALMISREMTIHLAAHSVDYFVLARVLFALSLEMPSHWGVHLADDFGSVALSLMGLMIHLVVRLVENLSMALP